MSDTSGILIQKPVSLLNKKINFNFGSFFTALTKAGANAAVANFGNIPENFVEVSDNIHLKNLFAEYQQAAEVGITRLLTAFYFARVG
ncbi:hypothetical protein [Trichormus variabilis]|uniref:Uncharacterized protein n=1 Tax=Trichormus variabilis SAG 1403-4b TaxID=447716 RepID=A0A3S1A6M8_ANAVA|nr:hypothetical protein [Trichormus variabilis]RUS94362.1 hypothetical protein DSM107003_38950 [Trichormus variabilis SAG 1403-4b]